MRRATRPIRRPGYAERLAPFRIGFPSELFGGELLGVLGSRLRALLTPAAPDADPDAAVRSALGIARGRVPGASVPSSRRPTDDADGVRALRGRRLDGSGRARPDVSPPEPADRLRADARAQSESVGSVRAPTAAGAALLEDRLRRYWLAALPRTERGAAPTTRTGSPRTVVSGHENREQQPSSRSRSPRQSETDLARELHAFVSDARVAQSDVGHGVPPEPDGVAPWPRVDEAAAPARRLGAAPRGGTPDSPRAGPTGLEPRERAAHLRELADEMTTILREQAIRHGIDIP